MTASEEKPTTITQRQKGEEEENSSSPLPGAVALIILGFNMAIVGNYNLWWGADSMIGVWGAVGILGLFMLIAGSVILNSARHR